MKHRDQLQAAINLNLDVKEENVRYDYENQTIVELLNQKDQWEWITLDDYDDYTKEMKEAAEKEIEIINAELVKREEFNPEFAKLTGRQGLHAFFESQETEEEKEEAKKEEREWLEYSLVIEDIKNHVEHCSIRNATFKMTSFVVYSDHYDEPHTHVIEGHFSSKEEIINKIVEDNIVI